MFVKCTSLKPHEAEAFAKTQSRCAPPPCFRIVKVFTSVDLVRQGVLRLDLTDGNKTWSYRLQRGKAYRMMLEAGISKYADLIGREVCIEDGELKLKK